MARNIVGHYPAKMCAEKVVKFKVKYEDCVVGLLTRRNREMLRQHFYRISP